MFAALRAALIAAFGDVGRMKTFVVDFELAAVNAIRDVFPETSVKGCTFHFRQALMRRIQSEGLKAVYEASSAYPAVREWMRQIMAMTILPVFAIPLAWNDLKCPPPTGVPSVDTRTLAFAAYFDSTWISGDLPPSMWSHYDNEGPRTTNQAEGYHNALNTSFGVPHPSLRIFLDWLQKCEFQVQCRLTQLSSGRPPKPKSEVYVRLDADIQAAKLKYGIDIGNVFAYTFPHDHAWTLFRHHTTDYLRRIAYLIGAN